MKISALIKRICRQMIRDKRTLALMMIAPLIILTLVHFLFTNDSTKKMTIGVTNMDPSFIQQLEKNDIQIKKYTSLNEKTLINKDLDGMIQMDHNHATLLLKNADPSSAKALQMKIQQLFTLEMKMKQANEVSNTSLQSPDMDISYVYGNKNTSFFDVLSPILVGFFVFFFVFLISGIALLRERTTGTLERLVATPIKRSEIVLGYLFGYGIFAIIQTVIIVLYATKILDITLIGSIWNVLLINLLLALVALSLGTLLSAFANTEFQMMQFIPVIVLPQVFFAGILPVDGMANWLQAVAKIMPMYYGGDALRSIMYMGKGFSDIRTNLLILFGFALLFVVLNVFALKKYRKI
ncbi:ABC transporter permease [Heyndrickxia oleronia]|uniref:ABC transporter permease n=1 Tax=Heyndrickxia oleronia TaxID=38875 RepID=UPI001B1B9580|nr:ABC transporter permease [Heyndrickxia oleronia]GIN40238.1 ABC transporter permease [Heyndrickxia oleronia]